MGSSRSGEFSAEGFLQRGAKKRQRVCMPVGQPGGVGQGDPSAGRAQGSIAGLASGWMECRDFMSGSRQESKSLDFLF